MLTFIYQCVFIHIHYGNKVKHEWSILMFGQLVLHLFLPTTIDTKSCGLRVKTWYEQLYLCKKFDLMTRLAEETGPTQPEADLVALEV